MEERDENLHEGKGEYAPPVVVDYGLLAKNAEAGGGAASDGGAYES